MDLSPTKTPCALPLPPPVSEAVTALFPIRIDLFAFLTILYNGNRMVYATYCLAFFHIG